MTMHDELRALRDDLRRRGKNNLALQMAHRETANRIDAILAKYADHVVVPREPTEAILMAGWRESNVYSPTAYRAMIQAAAKAEEE